MLLCSLLLHTTPIAHLFALRETVHGPLNNAELARDCNAITTALPSQQRKHICRRNKRTPVISPRQRIPHRLLSRLVSATPIKRAIPPQKMGCDDVESRTTFSPYLVLVQVSLLPRGRPGCYRVDEVENVLIPSVLRLLTSFDTSLNL